MYTTSCNFSQSRPFILRECEGNPTDDGICPAFVACSEILHDFSESLGLAIDARDPRTMQHSKQVADISLILSKAIGLDDDCAKTIHVAGHLHDIGKIATPDSILHKNGPLDEDEWARMREHPVVGARIVAPVHLYRGRNSIHDCILHHHERYDGKGYPAGLQGRDIPLGARIIAVADTTSAMIQDRSYRQGKTMPEVRAEILNNVRTQFCPVVVKAFVSVVERIEAYLSQDMNGISKLFAKFPVDGE
ncbi:MAG: HD domain-containing protein [Deltaproteobacteria bacterium]|nr:HD domain-containing protein [Deltaproteobacteria bacterium]